MSKKVTKPKARKFMGRIVKSPLDALTAFSGVRSTREVLFPESKADVATAIRLSQNGRVFFRSGRQAAAVTDGVDAVDGVVINLAELNNLDIKKGIVSAEVAATCGEMAENLAEHGLALPLGNNPQQSIASTVLHDGPSCLMRTLGPLSDYVYKLSAVAPDGKPMTRSGISAVARSRDSNAVITGVTFKPASATKLWMFRRSFPYPGKDQFASLAKALFLDRNIPPHSDLVLDAFSARHDLPVIRITAAGSAEQDETTLMNLVDKALSNLSKDFADEVIKENYSGSDVIKSIVDAGFGIPNDPGIDTHRVHQIVEPDADLNEFIGRLTEDVHRGLAFRDDNKGKIDEELRLFTRIQLNREDRIELSGFVFTHRVVQSSFPSRLISLTAMTREEMRRVRGSRISMVPQDAMAANLACRSRSRSRRGRVRSIAARGDSRSREP